MSDAQPKIEPVRHTPTPWFVRDFRETEMRRLGWAGPSIDRILITTAAVGGVEPDSGAVIARIQFDNRTELLGDNNLADAALIVEAVNNHATLTARIATLESCISQQDATCDAQGARIAELEKALREIRERANHPELPHHELCIIHNVATRACRPYSAGET